MTDQACRLIIIGKDKQNTICCISSGLARPGFSQLKIHPPCHTKHCNSQSGMGDDGSLFEKQVVDATPCCDTMLVVWGKWTISSTGYYVSMLYQEAEIPREEIPETRSLVHIFFCKCQTRIPYFTLEYRQQKLCWPTCSTTKKFYSTYYTPIL